MTTDKTDNTEINTNDNLFLYKAESFAIRGAMFEVYNQIGCGFLENVYQECLVREFRIKNIPFLSQPKLSVSYKGELLDLSYQPDFICYDKIIIEIKAVKEITDDHRAQILNYLKASGMRLGLLINFGRSPRVIIERYIR